MSKLPFFSRVVSAFPLALLLAGPLSARASESADPPSWTGIDVSTVTNVVFTEFDDFEDFRTNTLNNIDVLESRFLSLSNTLDHLYSEISALRTYAVLSQYNIGNEQYQNASVYLDRAIERADWALDSSSSAFRASKSFLTNDIPIMRSTLTQSVPTYMIMVDGGTGYECPDYTEVLNSISETVELMRDDTLWSTDILWNFFANADIATSGGFPSEHQEGAFFGSISGLLVSNLYSFVWSLADFSRFHSLDHYSQLSYGSYFSRDLWNYLLVPYSELLRDSSNPWVDENYMIGSFRDFYMNRQVVVSNAPGSSLSVQVSPDHPFSVVVTNTPYNPVWVDFTGTVDLAEGATLNITNSIDFPLFIDASDITNAIYSLTNAIFIVRVTNATDIGDSVVDAETTAVEDALANTGGDDDFESDDTSFPSDPNNYSAIASSIDRVYSSYSSMFSNIPNYLPNDIELHPGWSLAGVTVDPILWNTQDSASGLTHIRNLFCFFWFIPYAVVVFVCSALDLFVGGVMCYLAYGLLLGNSKVALDGIYWCYSCLCRLFGWDPPKR